MINLILQSQSFIKKDWVTRDTIALVLPFYRIGRSSRCEIYLDWWKTLTLSSVQGSFYQLPQTMKHLPGYSFRDGEVGRPSFNGCFLRGERIEHKIKLLHGDTIDLTLGLRMIYSNPTAPRISDAMEATLSDNGDALANLAI